MAPVAAVHAASAAPERPGRFDHLDCVTPQSIARVKSNIGNAKAALQDCRSELAAKLRPLHLTQSQEQVAFAAILASSMAPYGTSRSIELKDLLADQAMDCDNYAILTGYLAREFGAFSISFAGFDGGAIGNHAQLFISHPDGDMLLDPTIGLVARIGFDELLQGRPVASRRLKVFRQHEDKDIDAFAGRVSRAVIGGKYIPSDLLYYFHSLDEYIAFSNEIVPLWSQPTYDALIRRFPTPAAATLKKNLDAAKPTR